MKWNGIIIRPTVWCRLESMNQTSGWRGAKEADQLFVVLARGEQQRGDALALVTHSQLAHSGDSPSSRHRRQTQDASKAPMRRECAHKSENNGCKLACV